MSMPSSALSFIAPLARAALRLPPARICPASSFTRFASSSAPPPSSSSPASASPASPASSASSSHPKASSRPVVTEADTLTPAQLKAIQQLQELKREELEEADDGFVNSATGERGGPKGPEPTRFGDWERKGRVSDF